MSEPTEWLTVPQSAKRLGIQERQVRRYAARLTDSDRTQDRTETGRPRLLVRFSALLTLAGRQDNDRAETGQNDRAETGQNDRTRQDTPAIDDASFAETSLMPVAAYQRLMAEQDARINDQAARISALERDKEQLYAALTLSQENLQREQSLRLLTGPQAATEAEQEQDKSDTGQTQPRNLKKPGWWARIIGRREN